MTEWLMSKPLAALNTGGALWGLALFAQGAEATPATLVGAFIVISLSLSALVGFVMKKLLDDRTKLLEDAQKDRDQFRVAVEKLVTDKEKSREAEDERVRALVAGSDARFDRLANIFQQEQKESRSLVIQVAQAMRTAVHDVRDTAQSAAKLGAEAAAVVVAAKDKS